MHACIHLKGLKDLVRQPGYDEVRTLDGCFFQDDTSREPAHDCDAMADHATTDRDGTLLAYVSHEPRSLHVESSAQRLRTTGRAGERGVAGRVSKVGECAEQGGRVCCTRDVPTPSPLALQLACCLAATGARRATRRPRGCSAA